MKFKTGQKWLRSDGKVCVLIVWQDDSISDQDGVEYTCDGYSYKGFNLVSRVVSDDETIKAFLRVIDDLDNMMENQNAPHASITFDLPSLLPVSQRLRKSEVLLTELKQLISDSGEKGAAMITKIEEL